MLDNSSAQLKTVEISKKLLGSPIFQQKHVERNTRPLKSVKLIIRILNVLQILLSVILSVDLSRSKQLYLILPF